MRALYHNPVRVDEEGSAALNAWTVRVVDVGGDAYYVTPGESKVYSANTREGGGGYYVNLGEGVPTT